MNTAATIPELLAHARAHMAEQPEEATNTCRQAIFLAISHANKSAEADARHLFSQLLFSSGKSIEAIEEIKHAIALREKTGEVDKVSISYNNLGIYLTRIADYPAALDSCFSSLRIKEVLKDKRGIGNTLINIGSIYKQLNNHEQEMKMYERATQIAEEIDDKKMLAYTHLNLGVLYLKQKDYNKALNYLNNIDEVLYAQGDKLNALHALNNQGMLHVQLNRFEKAFEKYNRCLELSKETKNIPGMINSLMNLGDLKVKQGDYTQAKEYLDQAEQLALQHSLKSELKDVRLYMSAYYSGLNNYKQALEEYREHVTLKDELLNIHNLKQLGELQLKYELDKKEHEAEINHLKNVELKEALDKLQHEKTRSENLLLNILPEEVAEELKATGTAKAKMFERVTVMFIDIKNFTTISQHLSPELLVAEIDFLFRGFDEITKRFEVEKIKTIGDAYMCAGGIPVPDLNNAENVARAAFEILQFMEQLKQERLSRNQSFLEIRIGINTGAVVAGIVGSSKFAYDIWGDTVNTAARMEQSGEVGKINISGDTYELLKDKFNCTYRGKIHAKNKGEIDMYFLSPQ